MEGKAAQSLAMARWVVLAQYISGLVIFPIVAHVMYQAGKTHPLSTANARIIGLVLLAVGIIDYVVSLFVEKSVLVRAKINRQMNALVTAATMTGALGISLAIYGMILAYFQAVQFAIVLFGMCLLHGIHLLLRWQNYAEAAREIDAAS